MASPEARSRYWARNYAGWKLFHEVLPNDCHLCLTQLQQRDWIDYIITQNVDRLHQQAGSRHVVELHGSTHEVICTECSDVTERARFQEILTQLNPDASQLTEIHPEEQAPSAVKVDGNAPPVVRPDGDVELGGLERGFVVPSCLICDGILKPHVVFFGDSVPRHRANLAMNVSAESDALIVVGSSVAVYSAYRLVKAAKEHGARVVIINIGETRADDLCDLKISGVVGDVLNRLNNHPQLTEAVGNRICSR